LRSIPDCDWQSGTLLSGMPNAQDCHRPSLTDPVDNDVGRHRDQLACVGMTAGPASAGKHCQTIAGKQQFTSDSPCGHRIIDRDIANDPGNISQRSGAPNDGQGSARLGWRSVEFPFSQAQQPGTNRFVWDCARVCVRSGDGRRESASFRLGFVVLDQVGWGRHADTIAGRASGCIYDRTRSRISRGQLLKQDAAAPERFRPKASCRPLELTTEFAMMRQPCRGGFPGS
jgi:hypothetical protein